jgi:hypothetical protein
MTIVTHYQSHPVAVNDIYPLGPNDELYASITTTDGSQPFVMGDKWPVKSAFGVVRASELFAEECTCDERPNVLGDLCPACQAYQQALYGDELPY